MDFLFNVCERVQDEILILWQNFYSEKNATVAVVKKSF